MHSQEVGRAALLEVVGQEVDRAARQALVIQGAGLGLLLEVPTLEVGRAAHIVPDPEVGLLEASIQGVNLEAQ